MSLADNIKKIDVGIVAQALDVIGTLAKSANGHGAADIIMAIRHIYDAVVNAAENSVSPAEIRAELAKFIEGIEANDGAVDAALDDKFDKG